MGNGHGGELSGYAGGGGGSSRNLLSSEPYFEAFWYKIGGGKHSLTLSKYGGGGGAGVVPAPGSANGLSEHSTTCTFPLELDNAIDNCNHPGSWAPNHNVNTTILTHICFSSHSYEAQQNSCDLCDMCHGTDIECFKDLFCILNPHDHPNLKVQVLHASNF